MDRHGRPKFSKNLDLPPRVRVPCVNLSVFRSVMLMVCRSISLTVCRSMRLSFCRSNVFIRFLKSVCLSLSRSFSLSIYPSSGLKKPGQQPLILSINPFIGEATGVWLFPYGYLSICRSNDFSNLSISPIFAAREIIDLTYPVLRPHSHSENLIYRRLFDYDIYIYLYS